MMSAAFPFAGVAIVLALATCQHGDDAPFKKTCLPTHMIQFDSLAFTYDADHRPTALQYWRGDGLYQQYVMAYAGGQLSQCTRLLEDVEQESFSFVYGSSGKPVTRVRRVHGVATGDSVLYAHDADGRLVQMDFRSNGVFERRTRYEYHDDNNVHKIFQQTGDAPERIVFEYLSFDRMKRFFAYSPELTIVEIYLLETEPSLNNVFRFNYYPPPEDVFPLPVLVEYYLGYTPDTLIRQSHDFFYNDAPWPRFANADYTCY